MTDDAKPNIFCVRWNHYYAGELLGAHLEVYMEDSPKSPEEMPAVVSGLAYVRSEPFDG